MNDGEKNTVSKMIRIYCRAKHKQRGGLCPECKQLESYAHQRLEYCPYKENKPACEKCAIHCYKNEYKEIIKIVMRFSGPRMLFYHPAEAIRHFTRK
ncbi:MAG: nitrous oxide-stimulated promoter family protein [Candidatus Azobacteroides sp.]|nr:nitrous oxide-stimulated promoter family protein [Candidatus Azobacteroides sp.]